MLNDQRTLASITTVSQDNSGVSNSAVDDFDLVRDIHALIPPHPPPAPVNRGRRRESWETSSHRSSSISTASDVRSSENFTTMSREFNALVLAGAEIRSIGYNNDVNGGNNRTNLLDRIREDDMSEEETNRLTIVPGMNALDPIPTPIHWNIGVSTEISVEMVKKEEVETKISAWQNAKIAKLNNRFKREETLISGWESEQVQKSTSWMRKVERKLDENRARAIEKMENEVAKAHRKVEERKASTKSKRGTKVVKIHEIANLMRALGRAPAKRSCF